MANFQGASVALKFHQDALFKNSNLASLAVVEALDSDGKPTGEFFLEARVYSLDAQKHSVTTLKLDSDYSVFVPESVAIPESGGDSGALTKEEIKIVIEETDEVRALSFTDRRRPCAGGNSVGIASRRSAGTLGASITVNGKPGYFLSNWHVIHSGAGSTGSILTQPGPLDGGKLPNDRIGTLHWWALNSSLDAAIGKADKASDLRIGTRCYGRMNGAERAKSGMDVKKCGRTTEATQGVIRSVNASVRVSGYPSGTRLFTNQIQMSFMLRPGDSGSILINSRSNKAVGLCFAGSNSVSYANHIQAIGKLAESGQAINQDGSTLDLEPTIIEFDTQT